MMAMLGEEQVDQATEATEGDKKGLATASILINIPRKSATENNHVDGTRDVNFDSDPDSHHVGSDVEFPPDAFATLEEDLFDEQLEASHCQFSSLPGQVYGLGRIRRPSLGTASQIASGNVRYHRLSITAGVDIKVGE